MRRLTSLLAATTLAGLIIACGDTRNPGFPTDPSKFGSTRAISVGTCTTMPTIVALAKIVFSSGGPNVNSVLGKLDNVDKRISKGKITEAQEHAQSTIDFIQQKAAQGQLSGTHAQVQSLISLIQCYVGLPNSTLIYPSDQPQIIKDVTGFAGVSLDANPVNVPTLLTIQLLDPSGPSPLATKLDKYPGYVSLTLSGPLSKPAVVGVCPLSSVPANVRARLRLGHQSSVNGFELTPPADASFLDCTGFALSKTPGWLKSLASLVLPRPLYAAQFAFAGGVGGVANEFSPFGPVDPELSFAGGVGGVANEFTKRAMTPDPVNASKAVNAPTTAPESKPGIRKPSMLSPAVVGGVCTSVDALVGSPLEPECRPVVTITTHNGTIMQNVPVGWSVTGGGGVIAPQALANSTCGITFGSTASTTTNANGKASVCWTLGAAGSNTVVATPTAGGDAPAGVTFAPATGVLFTATALTITPTVTATGGNFIYDGQTHAGSGTCSNALVPSLTYSGTGAVPLNGGVYTLTVTCGAGNPVYNTVTATAGISIRFVQDNCFLPPLFPTVAAVNVGRGRGELVTTRCALRDAFGASITGATGDIKIEDIGTNGLATPASVFTLVNAFTAALPYRYDINVSSTTTYPSGHYFKVTATWSDQTTTVGYFRMQ